MGLPSRPAAGIIHDAHHQYTKIRSVLARNHVLDAPKTPSQQGDRAI